MTLLERIKANKNVYNDFLGWLEYECDGEEESEERAEEYAELLGIFNPLGIHF